MISGSKILISAASLMPLTAAAATFATIFADLGAVIGFAIPMLMVLATVLFLWGVIAFLANPDNEDARTEGRNFMILGIICLFVMIALWGLVDGLYNSFFG